MLILIIITLIINATSQIVNLQAQIANLIGLGDRVVAGNRFIDALRRIAMGTTCMTGFDTITLINKSVSTYFGIIIISSSSTIKHSVLEWTGTDLDFAGPADLAGPGLAIDGFLPRSRVGQRRKRIVQ